MAENTYFELIYKGPWKGLNVSMPETEIDRAEFNFIQNFVLKNSELRTRPLLNFLLPATAMNLGGGGDGTPIRMIAAPPNTGLAATPIFVTEKGIYSLALDWINSPSTGFNFIAAISNLGPNPNQFFYPNVKSLGNLYFCPGWGNLIQITGALAVNQNIATLAHDPDMGNNPSSLGGYFLAELGSHLLMANTITRETVAPFSNANFPWRMRWSASGNFTQWDPTVDLTAGFVDLADTNDAIYGLLTIGRTGFILREQGITEIIEVGQGGRPFDFDHLWAANRGIGSVIPFCVASYGSIGVFIASDNVYQMGVANFKVIGTKVIDAILVDLAQNPAFFNSTSNIPPILFNGTGIQNPPIAAIVPKFSDGYVYPCYVLVIPLGLPPKTGNSIPIATAVWVYDFKDESWTRWFHNSGYMTTPPITVSTACTGQVRVENNLSGNLAMFGFVSKTTGIGTYDYAAGTPPADGGLGNSIGLLGNFNCEENSNVAFKMEDIKEGRTATIHKAIIFYRNFGQAQFTITTFYYSPLDNTWRTQTSAVQNIGSLVADFRINSIEVPILITGERPQIQVNVVGNSGPVSITKVVVCGNMGEGPHI